MTLFNTKKGYTLLFAIIVSSVVLTIASFIVSISRKQFIIASASRDSTKAIYAADAGIQCAISHFNPKLELPSSIPLAGDPLSLKCNSIDIGVTWRANDSTDDMDNDAAFNDFNKGTAVVAELEPVYFSTNNACAKTKIYIGNNSSDTSIRLVMESRGYNISDSPECPVVNSRTVERAIYVSY